MTDPRTSFNTGPSLLESLPESDDAMRSAKHRDGEGADGEHGSDGGSAEYEDGEFEEEDGEYEGAMGGGYVISGSGGILGLIGSGRRNRLGCTGRRLMLLAAFVVLAGGGIGAACVFLLGDGGSDAPGEGAGDGGDGGGGGEVDVEGDGEVGATFDVAT